MRSNASVAGPLIHDMEGGASCRLDLYAEVRLFVGGHNGQMEEACKLVLKAGAGHIATLLACAEICDTSARFMLLGSEHHGRTCDVCAEVTSIAIREIRNP